MEKEILVKANLIFKDGCFTSLKKVKKTADSMLVIAGKDYDFRMAFNTPSCYVIVNPSGEIYLLK